MGVPPPSCVVVGSSSVDVVFVLDLSVVSDVETLVVDWANPSTKTSVTVW